MRTGGDGVYLIAVIKRGAKGSFPFTLSLIVIIRQWHLAPAVTPAQKRLYEALTCGALKSVPEKWIKNAAVPNRWRMACEWDPRNLIREFSSSHLRVSPSRAFLAFTSGR